MLANIAGLNLPARLVARREGQATPLETLHQHQLPGAGNHDIGPVGLGDRPASGVERVLKQLVGDKLIVLPDRAFRVHERPKWRGDVVAGDVVIETVADFRNTDRRIMLDKVARTGDPVDDQGIATILDRVKMIQEAGIRRAVWIVGIAGDIHLRREPVLVLLGKIVDLQLTGDHLNDQQAVGDVPDRIRITFGMGDLHARLVEILHRPLLARRLEVLLLHLLAVRQTPHPGALDSAILDWFVSSVPGALEVIVGHLRCLGQHALQAG